MSHEGGEGDDRPGIRGTFGGQADSIAVVGLQSLLGLKTFRHGFYRELFLGIGIELVKVALVRILDQPVFRIAPLLDEEGLCDRIPGILFRVGVKEVVDRDLKGGVLVHILVIAADEDVEAPAHGHHEGERLRV